MNTSKMTLYRPLSWALLAGALVFVAGCQASSRITAVDTAPPPDVSDFMLAYERGKVTFSWNNPDVGDLDGVQIRRRDDGYFPENPGDGMLIYEAGEEEEAASEFIPYDGTQNPASFYYTAFAYDRKNLFSSGARSGLYCDESGCIIVPNLEELNQIHTMADAERVRSDLRHFIWGTVSLPDRTPNDISGIQDDRYPSASRVDKLTIKMDTGFRSTAYFLQPRSPRSQLMIYHQGHLGDFHLGAHVINRFLDEGFHVLAYAMPLVGLNESPDPGIVEHDDMASLDRPMRYFLEPITVGLNYAETLRDFEGIYMTGISGGGWTTVVYSALDPRIDASYPVAGSYPLYIRTQIESSDGDFEQINPELYQTISYLELYLLGASSRRQLQIFNRYDPCCFEGTYALSYRNYLQDTLLELGGSFDVLIDENQRSHEISSFALEAILSDVGAFNKEGNSAYLPP